MSAVLTLGHFLKEPYGCVWRLLHFHTYSASFTVIGHVLCKTLKYTYAYVNTVLNINIHTVQAV